MKAVMKAVMKIDWNKLKKAVSQMDANYDTLKEVCKGDTVQETKLVYKQSGIVELFCWLVSNAQFVIEEGEDND